MEFSFQPVYKLNLFSSVSYAPRKLKSCSAINVSETALWNCLSQAVNCNSTASRFLLSPLFERLAAQSLSSPSQLSLTFSCSLPFKSLMAPPRIRPHAIHREFSPPAQSQSPRPCRRLSLTQLSPRAQRRSPCGREWTLIPKNRPVATLSRHDIHCGLRNASIVILPGSPGPSPWQNSISLPALQSLCRTLSGGTPSKLFRQVVS